MIILHIPSPFCYCDQTGSLSEDDVKQTPLPKINEHALYMRFCVETTESWELFAIAAYPSSPDKYNFLHPFQDDY